MSYLKNVLHNSQSWLLDERSHSTKKIPIPKLRNPDPVVLAVIPGIFSEFLGIFKYPSRFPDFWDFAFRILLVFLNSYLDLWNFEIPEIFLSSSKFKISILDRRDRDSGSLKNPISKPTLVIANNKTNSTFP